MYWAVGRSATRRTRRQGGLKQPDKQELIGRQGDRARRPCRMAAFRAATPTDSSDFLARRGRTPTRVAAKSCGPRWPTKAACHSWAVSGDPST